MSFCVSGGLHLPSLQTFSSWSSLHFCASLHLVPRFLCAMAPTSSGICDDDVGECYCPPETRFGLKRHDDPAAKLKARPMNNVHPMTVSVFWLDSLNLKARPMNNVHPIMVSIFCLDSFFVEKAHHIIHILKCSRVSKVWTCEEPHSKKQIWSSGSRQGKQY